MPKKQSSDAQKAAGKKAGKNSKKDDDAAAKPSKASKKAARAAAEAERARDVERMLAPASDDEAATDSEGEWTTDKAGNTISKAEARRKEEEEAMRAAAKKRRAAKASAAPAAVDEGRPQWLVDYDRVKAKAEAGGKLSGKEKKLLKRGQAREAEEAELGLTTGGDDTRTVDARLEGFSLSVPGGATRAADDASKDVVVKGLSISAPEKPLLVNADLALVAGRRYGLVGANGRGKSTLLRFIAARRLPVPQSVDVLLVDQGASFQGASVLEDARGQRPSSLRPRVCSTAWRQGVALMASRARRCAETPVASPAQRLTRLQLWSHRWRGGNLESTKHTGLISRRDALVFTRGGGGAVERY